MNKTFLILLAVVILVGGFLWSTYNGLISLNEKIDGQWAQVETQYQRRFDLIPNLIESVKGVMKQEQKIFGDIAEARTRYTSAVTTEEKLEATQSLETGLGRLIAVMENYPQIKSSENVNTLMSQLEGTENRINVERMRFNEFVQSFNIKVKRFPTNMIANMLGYTERTYFEIAEGVATNPVVNLNIE